MHVPPFKRQHFTIILDKSVKACEDSNIHTTVTLSNPIQKQWKRLWKQTYHRFTHRKPNSNTIQYQLQSQYWPYRGSYALTEVSEAITDKYDTYTVPATGDEMVRWAEWAELETLAWNKNWLSSCYHKLADGQVH